MTQAFDAAGEQFSLRQRALLKLTIATKTDLDRATPVRALAVLHQLASSPATASDALALLHELQVHQVQLELQQEEVRNARTELEEALIRQTAMVDRAPVAYVSIDAHTALWELNLAALRLLGGTRDELLGRPLAAWLTAAGADRLQTLLGRVGEGKQPEPVALQLLPAAGRASQVLATADADAASGRFLLVLMAVPG